MLGTVPNVNMMFMKPVNAGFIRYSDLSNGSITLFDVFVMNEFLQYKNEYEELVTELSSREV
jgi:hypothetical protein